MEGRMGRFWKNVTNKWFIHDIERDALRSNLLQCNMMCSKHIYG
jgi:hypothetical protein